MTVSLVISLEPRTRGNNRDLSYFSFMFRNSGLSDFGFLQITWEFFNLLSCSLIPVDVNFWKFCVFINISQSFTGCISVHKSSSMLLIPTARCSSLSDNLSSSFRACHWTLYVEFPRFLLTLSQSERSFCWNRWSKRPTLANEPCLSYQYFR